MFLHEYNHRLNDFPSITRTFHKNIVEQNVFKKDDERLPKNISDKYEYFTDPDEVHSRIMVLRRNMGVNPNEKVSKERLTNYLKNYQGKDENILQIINMADENGLLEMLNYMALNNNKSKDTTQLAQQGGNFTENELAFLSEIAVKDNKGYWNPNNQGKVVQIDGGKISMKNVNQELLGVSDTGEQKTLKPNKEYNFKNAKFVVEIPFFKNK